MANTARPQITVDDRGRTSLAKVRRQRHGRYACTEHPDGTLVLVPVISLTPAELAALRGGDLGAEGRALFARKAAG